MKKFILGLIIGLAPAILAMETLSTPEAINKTATKIHVKKATCTWSTSDSDYLCSVQYQKLDASDNLISNHEASSLRAAYASARTTCLTDWMKEEPCTAEGGCS